MKEIPLTQGKVALVDDDHFELAKQFKWHAYFDRFNWYARRNIPTPGKPRRQTSITLHRFLFPGHTRLDHKDGNGLNCQRYNVRPATPMQNTANSRKSKNCTSKFKGVSWRADIKCWRSRIKVNRKQIFLGNFLKEKVAARAYDVAALKHFGEFAKLNFPNKQ